MSHRPINRKRANKMRRALTRPLPAFINLEEWLRDRGHADTAGAARKLLTDGRVKTRGGNVLGRKMYEEPGDEGEPAVITYLPDPIVPKAVKPELVVVKA